MKYILAYMGIDDSKKIHILFNFLLSTASGGSWGGG